MSFYEELKTIGDGIMESRANQLCPTGYTILNQDAYKITDYGRYGTQVVWQIRCKNPEQAS